RRDRPLPDQVVDPGHRLGVPAAVRTDLGLDVPAGTRHRGRADALVGLLGTGDLLVVVLVAAGPVLVAEAGADQSGGLVDGLRGHRGRIGPHVGDVAAFIEALRHSHGPPGRRAE